MFYYAQTFTLCSNVSLNTGNCSACVAVRKISTSISVYINTVSVYINEPPHDKTNKMTYAPCEDSDQPGHPPSLIRVFAVHMKKTWVLSYPLSAQRRLWSDWADAQADLSHRWAHSHFVGFVMRRLKCSWCHQHETKMSAHSPNHIECQSKPRKAGSKVYYLAPTHELKCLPRDPHWVWEEKEEEYEYKRAYEH